jgi:hypothetical protein
MRSWPILTVNGQRLDRYLWLTGMWLRWKRWKHPNRKPPINAEVLRLFKTASDALHKMLPEGLHMRGQIE